MPLPSMMAIARKLSLADVKRLLVLKRSLPKLDKLTSRRKQIVKQLAAVDRELVKLALADNGEPKNKQQRVSRPGRKPASQGKPERKSAVKRGSGNRSIPTAPGAKAQRTALLERLAKARAVLAAKRQAAAKDKASKVKAGEKKTPKKAIARSKTK